MFHEPVKPIKYDILKNYAKIRCKIKSPSACTKILKRNNNRNKWLWHNSYFKSNMKFSLLYTTNKIEPSNSLYAARFNCIPLRTGRRFGHRWPTLLRYYKPPSAMWEYLLWCIAKKVDNVARRSVHSM